MWARRPVSLGFRFFCEITRRSYAPRKKRKRYEVTLDFALQKWRGAKIAKRTAERLLAARGIQWRRPREKPILTPEDVKDRLRFAKKFKGKSPKFWRNCAALDGKSFAVVLNAKHRRRAGPQRLRGIYRKGGTVESLASFRVRKKGKERQMVGGRLGIIGAICGPRQEVFIYEIKDTWSAAEAVKMYRELGTFLKKYYPKRRRWTLIEDNDPGGLATKAANKVKKQLSMDPIGLPKRSPDLSPMDYAVWDHVVAKMRSHERRMGIRKETKAKYIDRLKRTIKTADKKFLSGVQCSMRRRLQQVYARKGGLIEE